jgi:hypothetical protein
MGYAAALLACVLLGLASRAYQSWLPEFLAVHAGDALWAGMIYCGVRMLAVNRSIAFAAFVSLLFCFAIEFSQLYQGDWLNQLRATTLGALALGHGFLAVDLLRYSAGIALALTLDAGWLRIRGYRALHR